MKVTLDQLKKLLSTYKMRVIRVQPMDHGFTIDTNKGKKRVTVWENAELLKWSNGWREELFAQGFLQVERFLLNANNKRYIRYQGKYFVVSNVPEGRSLDPTQREECRAAGEILAGLHLAIDRLEQKITLATGSEVDEDYFSQGSTTIKQVIQSIEQKPDPTFIDEVIYSNLPLLYKRFRRAYQLWEGVKDSLRYFPLSLSSFCLEQITQKGKEWLVSGGYNQPLAPMHQDTVTFIREIYEKSQWNLSSVSSFLAGYEQKRKLTDNELIYILVHLALPWEVWNHFSYYLTNPYVTEEQAEKLVEDIRRQNYWDQLTVLVGRIIDQRNEATA